MTGKALKSFFANLPIELLHLIIPDPAVLHDIKAYDNRSNRQRWLAINCTKGSRYTSSEMNMPCSEPVRETLQMLRALSHTSRRLRALTLPMLWSVVHIATVDELSRFNQVLKEADWIAPLVRHFSFFWDLKGEYVKLDPYPEEHGSVLDMAFIDRGALWDRIRQDNDYVVEVEWDDEASQAYFIDEDGAKFLEPGFNSCGMHDLDAEQQIAQVPDEDKDADVVEQLTAATSQGLTECVVRRPSEGRSGPDCNGLDEADDRIRNPDDFHEALTFITSQLNSIEAYRWHCPVAHLPVGVFDALQHLPTLTTFHLDMTARRSSTLSLPVWELAPSLNDLALVYHSNLQRHKVDDEVSERSLASFEFPRRLRPRLRISAPTNTAEADDALLYSIVCRFIVAAARGGNLRRLDVQCCFVQAPFAVRTLLPCWIGLDELIVSSMDPGLINDTPALSWHKAPEQLLYALAHASLWLPSRSGTLIDRRLTMRDVQSLACYYSPTERRLPWTQSTNSCCFEALMRYLFWLEKDAKLAQQVADAWNAVVARGETSLAQCCCAECKERLSSG